ncbi:MAG: response regulator [Bdellovibrionales bacterium]|nr:response regulator [Bdellovibrionales bacterium]
MFNILHLEDEKEFHNLVKDFLPEDSYQLYHAPDTIEALKLINFVDFDFVISDFYLNSNITSSNFIKKLKSALPEVPIAIHSSASLVEISRNILLNSNISVWEKTEMRKMCLFIKYELSQRQTKKVAV